MYASITLYSNPIVSVWAQQPGKAGIANTSSQSSSSTSAEKLSAMSAPFNGSELLGLNKAALAKRFSAPQYKHLPDFSQVNWHGTDMSSVLDFRFKKGRVCAVRLITHYGYDRAGTTSNVDMGKWITATK